MLISNKSLFVLREQGFAIEHRKTSLRQFYGRYEDLTKYYEVPSLFRMLNGILKLNHIHYSRRRWDFTPIIEIFTERVLLLNLHNGCG